MQGIVFNLDEVTIIVRSKKFQPIRGGSSPAPWLLKLTSPNSEIMFDVNLDDLGCCWCEFHILTGAAGQLTLVQRRLDRRSLGRNMGVTFVCFRFCSGS